ncbi:hypothetical protein L228DRAFT_264660 [Xylona heveae TC161]|uniref:N-alpha-acetyltransferase 40 n=1 Tax=Xylona heveae (strain CBS 132557 / TC161) TaxID=1328760 RepID=A0A165JHA5_XYLHT|nr:hypothetical protein L228DRAFT_264660 [Xylona heveae TC161]KZF26239.1 hypothetical protein L228DRAFT_264660 [Xylona heveae TC161]
MVKRQRSPSDPAPTPMTHELRIEAANKLSLETFQTRFFLSDVTSANKAAERKIKGNGNKHTDHQGNDALTAFTRPSDGARYTISLVDSTSISHADFVACFELIRSTSAAMYKMSDRGWSARRKKAEMADPDMRFLLVRKRDVDREGYPRGDEERETGHEDNGKNVKRQENGHKDNQRKENGHTKERAQTQAGTVEAFLSFMLTYEDDREVVYCYEIHLSSTLRGCGLGRHLMNVLESIGTRVGVEAAMLTCFTKNESGLRFYERLGYVEDEFSPPPRKLRSGKVEKPSYIIMSKPLRREVNGK